MLYDYADFWSYFNSPDSEKCTIETYDRQFNRYNRIRRGFKGCYRNFRPSRFLTYNEHIIGRYDSPTIVLNNPEGLVAKVMECGDGGAATSEARTGTGRVSDAVDLFGRFCKDSLTDEMCGITNFDVFGDDSDVKLVNWNVCANPDLDRSHSIVFRFPYYGGVVSMIYDKIGLFVDAMYDNGYCMSSFDRIDEAYFSDYFRNSGYDIFEISFNGKYTDFETYVPNNLYALVSCKSLLEIKDGYIRPNITINAYGSSDKTYFFGDCDREKMMECIRRIRDDVLVFTVPKCRLFCAKNNMKSEVVLRIDVERVKSDEYHRISMFTYDDIPVKEYVRKDGMMFKHDDVLSGRYIPKFVEMLNGCEITYR